MKFRLCLLIFLWGSLLLRIFGDCHLTWFSFVKVRNFPKQRHEGINLTCNENLLRFAVDM